MTRCKVTLPDPFCVTGWGPPELSPTLAALSLGFTGNWSCTNGSRICERRNVRGVWRHLALRRDARGCEQTNSHPSAMAIAMVTPMAGLNFSMQHHAPWHRDSALGRQGGDQNP